MFAHLAFHLSLQHPGNQTLVLFDHGLEARVLVLPLVTGAVPENWLNGNFHEESIENCFWYNIIKMQLKTWNRCHFWPEKGFLDLIQPLLCVGFLHVLDQGEEVVSLSLELGARVHLGCHHLQWRKRYDWWESKFPFESLFLQWHLLITFWMAISTWSIHSIILLTRVSYTSLMNE